MLTPDLARATLFLDLLKPARLHTFQTIAEGPARGPTGSAITRVFHGTFGNYADVLVKLNDQGAGIFVMTNTGDGLVQKGSTTSRTTGNVTDVPALFVDLDGAPILPVLTSALPPDWVVQSSRGRWHAYWTVEDCPLDAFGRAQAALAARFGGDPAVKDLPRVMRIPGFLHRKAEPFLSKLYLPAEYDQLLEQTRGS